MENLEHIYQPITELEGFSLSPFRKEYIKTRYLNWFHDIDVTRFTSHSGMSESRALEYIKQLGYNNYAWSIFTERTNSRGYHIGNVALQNIDLKSQSAEFAIIIGEKDYWGKGITKKCLEFIKNQAFEHYGLRRLWLGTAIENHGMRNAALKTGFKEEGILKEHLFCNGGFMDCVMYGLIKNEK